jgi:DNA repair protein RecO (recombination protein O)
VSGPARVDHAPAYVLHTYPYRETSLIVEVLARDHGRIGLIARGARRPRAALRGQLIQFQPLGLSWSGKGELRVLQKAEFLGGWPMPRGEALLCGFYLNELLLRLLPRDDAHPALFAAYAGAVERLAAGFELAASLRRFEKALLRELGYALVLDRDAVRGTPIDPTSAYGYEPERGPVAIVNGAAPAARFTGRALLAIAADDYSEPETLSQSRALMRLLIGHRLESQPLHSRRILADLQAL